MSQKVLQISSEDAKYIDPNQVASLTMVDGSVILVRGNDEGFVEEAQEGGEQYDQQGQQPQNQQRLRGLGTNLAVAATAGLVGAAVGAALGGTKRGPGMMAPMGMARPGMMAPMGMARRGMVGAPMGMARPGMVGVPMGMARPGMVPPPMGRFRARKQDTNEEVCDDTQEVCPYCNK